MGSGQAGKVFHLCLVANAAALLVLLRLTSNLGIDFMLFPEPGHTGNSRVEKPVPTSQDSQDILSVQSTLAQGFVMVLILGVLFWNFVRSEKDFLNLLERIKERLFGNVYLNK